MRSAEQKAWRREREEAGKAPSLALITCVRARGRGKREEERDKRAKSREKRRYERREKTERENI